jgi:hypothetical protein
MAGIAINVVLAIEFAAGLAFTVYMINDSWGRKLTYQQSDGTRTQ